MRRPSTILPALLTTLCVSTAAAEERAEQNTTPAEESGPVLGTRPNTPLLFSGALVGGLSYGVPLAVGVTYFALVWPFQAAFFDNPKPPDTILYMMIPLVGPIFAANTEFSDGNPWVKTAFYVDSGLQFVGVGLIITSLILREEVRVKSSRLYLGPGPGTTGLTLGVHW